MPPRPLRSIRADFYPRPPRGGRPSRYSTSTSSVAFLSTPSARRATLLDLPDHGQQPISIHALREEGDATTSSAGRQQTRFLSTPSARRATDPRHRVRALGSNFYPRPPRGGRPSHALLLLAHRPFLSTPSARRATSSPARSCCLRGHFYPRPPRGGRLAITRHLLRSRQNFYPRPPRGGRPPVLWWLAACRAYFYPRPPRGGRPEVGGPDCRIREISIHALREEGDPQSRRQARRRQQFLSTPSARRATLSGDQLGLGRMISIHALREEGDIRVSGSSRPPPIFLSTPSARRATRRTLPTRTSRGNFYPRPPRGGRPLSRGWL